MATSLHTFADIFQTDFENHGEQVRLQKIVIPMIQRDYAQGRRGAEIERVRMRFLEALYMAVTDTPITLDFIYGDIDANGVMTPLDGQQRLTTLFLLHWYGAKKENVNREDYAFLEQFSYETRYSARDFCDFLVGYDPTFEGKLSEEIIDQPWFPLDWRNDPTVSAMLVMLDCIDEKFSHVQGLWEKLLNYAISFYFLPVKDMGLTDELYIRMNSRGKPLTMFEHFKAELERELLKVDKNIAKNIIRKIDLDWTDMLWEYRGGDHVTDDEFLRYFHFVCDVLCYRRGGTPQGKDSSEFSLLSEFFGADSEDVKDNINFLENSFDCWCKVKKEETIEGFFEDRVAAEQHEAGKIIADDTVNYFEDCLRTYGMAAGNGNRLYTLGKTVILYAFLVYLLHRDSISDEAFRRRIRVIRNLVDNSEDEISDSEARVGGNRMPAILKQVDSIILYGIILDDIEINFNAYQLSEEKEKLIWTKAHPAQAEALFALEDHYLLYGQVGIIGLEHPEYFGRFLSLFDECDYDAIDCALITIGNYMQCEKNGWRYQSGSSKYDKPWRNLFHRSASGWFDHTKKCMAELLSKAEIFSNDILIGMKNEYLASCEEKSLYDWRYYYLKYDCFRPGRYGKYWWNDFEQRPYEFVALWTERQVSQNAYQPFLKAVDKEDNISRDDMGQCLVFDETYVEAENDAYVVKDLDTNEEIRKIEITQNGEGIDTEDRIQKYLNTKGEMR